MGPGPGETHGLYSTCPTPSSFKPCTLPPLAWASSQETDIPSPGPSPLGDMSQQVQAQQEAGSRCVWGAGFELGVSVGTPLQALLQAYLPTGLSKPGD